MKKARTHVAVPLKLNHEKVREMTPALSTEQLAEVQGGVSSRNTSRTQTSTSC